MKYVKYLLIALAMVSGAAITSCQKDNVAAIYNPNGAELSFSSASMSLSAPAVDPVVSIPIFRGNTKGAYTATIASTTSDPAVTVPSTVEFADGEGIGYLKVDISKKTVDEVSIKLSIAEADMSAGCISEINVTAALEYVWVQIGTATFYYNNPLIGEAEDPGLPFFKREDNPNVMKVSNWFYGVDFVFTLMPDGSVYVKDQYTGYTDPTYGKIYVCDLSEYDPEAEKGSYDAETGTFTFKDIYYDSTPWDDGDTEYLVIDK